MAKFKVGDKVVVLMDAYQKINRGDTGVVTEFYTDWECVAAVQFDSHSGSFPFDLEALELAGPYGKYHMIAREICGR